MPTAIKRVEFSPDGRRLLAVTEKRMGYQGTITVFDVNYDGDYTNQSDEPSMKIVCEESKATVAGWSAFGRHIIAGHENGSISQYDAKVGIFLFVIQVRLLLDFAANLNIYSPATKSRTSRSTSSTAR